MITLKTLPQATAQEVFDQVATHLLTQKERSIVGGTSEECVYKNDSGLKCAAGCLISEEEYLPEFEGRNWAALCQNKEVPEEHVGLIHKLQSIHDSSQPKEWKTLLTHFAEIEKLNTTAIEKF